MWFHVQLASMVPPLAVTEYGDIIVGRMGIPYRDRGVSVIALIVDGDTDVLGAITGKLGGVPGVRVRSALT
ncbi:MAG TPA: CopG family transcriptional regulator [Bacillota bacterium]|nr:CopG family transcriptional regulator [Bacillota bacterium]HPU62296.1 CopG family transcriptional regulator [Bacillota bacterium]